MRPHSLRHRLATATFSVGALIGAAIQLPAPALAASTPEPRGIGQGHWNDFDGNGYADLAIGVPRADVAGKNDAGVVHVLYAGNGGSGPNATGSQVWHQDVAGVLDVTEAGDRFGSSLAAGDFDIDGFGDLAIGVPGEDLGAGPDAGVVAVLFGGPGGLSARDRFFAPALLGSEEESEAGSALVALDYIGVDGNAGSDGRADLAIGAPGWAGERGAIAYVSGTQLTPEQMTGTKGVVAFSADPLGSRNGMVLTAGDFNDDPTDDLVIGAPLADVAGDDGLVVDAGRIRVWYDRGSGMQVLDQAALGGAAEPKPGERFGSALAANAFGGTYHQLWVGVPYEDHPGAVDAGSIDRYLAASNGSGLIGTSATEFRLGAFAFGGTPKPGDRFGSAIAIANFGMSYFTDVAVGVPGRDVEGVNGAGAVGILYANVESTFKFLRQGINGVADHAEAGDGFGSVLFTADFAADPGPGSWADLAIGVPREDVGAKVDAGAVHVLKGDPDLGLRTTDDRFWHVDSPGIARVAAADDRFGSAVR